MGKFVSIVAPSLNEELTIGEFIRWCKEGFAKAGVEGEILIIDSSADKTAKIAEVEGARVVKAQKRGLGYAYNEALPYIRGDYLIMGDCDLTYDFREIKPFIKKLDEGYEFVMGTRTKGYIEPEAMPNLHRYFGIPVTTFILNLIYGSRYSDIHCGMRAITLNALKRIGIESKSWEYASEMVLKAAKYKLKTTEVPIRYYKDKKGRVSHHKRLGWFSPWYAGWINLQVMFLYAPDFFLMKPGIISMCIGLIISFSLAGGPVKVFGKTLSLYWMLSGVSMAIIGFSAIQMAILARVCCDFTADKASLSLYKRIFNYNTGMVTGLSLFIGGLALLLYFVAQYISNNFMLSNVSYSAIFGLLILIIGFQTFTFTLLFNLISHKMGQA